MKLSKRDNKRIARKAESLCTDMGYGSSVEMCKQVRAALRREFKRGAKARKSRI